MKGISKLTTHTIKVIAQDLNIPSQHTDLYLKKSEFKDTKRMFEWYINLNTPHTPSHTYKNVAKKTNSTLPKIKHYIKTNTFPDKTKHKILYELAKAAQIPSHLLKQHTGFDIKQYEQSRKERKDWIKELGQ